MRAAFALVLAVLLGCGGSSDPAPSSDVRPVDDPDVFVADVTSPADDVEPADDPDAAPSPDTADTDEPATDVPSEDPDTFEPPTTVIGQVNAVVWDEDALFPWADLHVHGAFSQSLVGLDVLDPVGWLAAWAEGPAFVPDDYWPLPTPGQAQEISFQPPSELPADDTLDAGDFVALGGHAVAHLLEDVAASGGPRLYDSPLEVGFEQAEMVPAGVPLDLEIDGGADVSQALVPDAARIPDAFDFSSHDTARMLPIRFGQPLHFAWSPSSLEPSDEDALLVTVEGEELFQLARVPDNGTLDLESAFPGLLGQPGGLFTISFQRVRQRWVQLVDGVVRLVTARKVWFYTEDVGSWDIEPRVVHVGVPADVRIRLFDHTLAQDDLDIEFQPPLPFGAAVVADTVGHEVRLQVTPTAGVETGPRRLVVRMGDAVLLDAPEALWVAAPLPSAGDCQSAVDEGPVPDGTWFTTDAGLEDGEFSGTASCPWLSPTGREQAVPIALEAGQRLTARLWSDVHAVLYLADTCGGTSWGCTTAWDKDRPATLEYTAESDETVLLVLDSVAFPDGPPLNVLLDLRRTPPAPLSVFPAVVPAGGSASIDVFSAHDLPAQPAAYDLGPQITVEGVELFDADWAVLDVKAQDLSAPALATLTVDVDNTTLVLPDAVTIRPYLIPASACDPTAAPLAPGTYDGLVFMPELLSQTPCGASDFSVQGVVRVDLGPGETLHASVVSEAYDTRLHLVLDCSAPSAKLCADEGGPQWGEYVTWTGPAEASTVYLVIEALDDLFGAEFTLDLEVGP